MMRECAIHSRRYCPRLLRRLSGPNCFQALGLFPGYLRQTPWKRSISTGRPSQISLSLFQPCYIVIGGITDALATNTGHELYFFVLKKGVFEVAFGRTLL